MFDTSTVPSWVSAGSIRKWNRAVAQLTKDNADRIKSNMPTFVITEEALFELYTKWGGLVVGTPSFMEVVAEPADIAVTDSPDAEVEKPVKKGKK